MIYDSIALDRGSKTPLYVQLYENMRASIGGGLIIEGEKMPSVRVLSKTLGISRSTVELAYSQLTVEGYITPRAQSGYYASGVTEVRQEEQQGSEPERRESRQEPRYSFRSDYVDSSVSDLCRWRRHVRAVLNEQETAASYGDPQGEPELRRQLARYCHTVRGVNASADRIIIGAGIQPLLSLLCGLIGERVKTGIEQSGFVKAERIFRDFGCEIAYISADSAGIQLSQAQSDGIGLLYLNQSATAGGNMPASRRGKLLSWAERENALIVEDDYNGELRFSARPIPSLQSIDSSGRVIYLGSFSKLLMPSVRLSYMLLPERLAELYQTRRGEYNQTSSKIEQLALASYMQTGELERQLRRLRKLYSEKSEILLDSLAEQLPEAKTELHETALCVRCTLEGADALRLMRDSGARGVAVRAENCEGGARLDLSFAGIRAEDIRTAVRMLADSVHKTEHC